MKFHRTLLTAALACAAATSAVAATQVIAVPTGEKGYVTQADPAVPGKSRAEVVAERSQVAGRNTVGDRYTRLTTPPRTGSADGAAVRRGAVEATRLPMGEN